MGRQEGSLRAPPLSLDGSLSLDGPLGGPIRSQQQMADLGFEASFFSGAAPACRRGLAELSAARPCAGGGAQAHASALARARVLMHERGPL